MVKISLELSKLHPAFISALPETVDGEKVLAAINSAIKEAGGEQDGNIRSKNVKDNIVVNASGKLTGLKFKKDSPAGLAARVNWFLFGSAELFTRVDAITLPMSVSDWLKSKDFAKVAAPAPAEAVK